MKQKNKHAKCPCCLTEKHRTEITICLSILEKIDQQEYKNYKELQIDSYHSFIESDFEWACDSCLESKKAILARPRLQTYAWSPNLAYADKDLTCRKCKSDFRFTKEEKQLWYEKLKFWIDSEPVNCLACRREIKQLKMENTILSDILKKGESELTLDELQIVSDIYQKWDKTERAKFYDALIRKKMLGNT